LKKKNKSWCLVPLTPLKIQEKDLKIFFNPGLNMAKKFPATVITRFLLPLKKITIGSA
jgi:hypothetical protein